MVKLAKLTRIESVYCGISNDVQLNQEFWRENDDGCTGGTEAIFLSTTRDREAVMEHALRRGERAVMIELRMGMVDRGADGECARPNRDGIVRACRRLFHRSWCVFLSPGARAVRLLAEQ